LPSFGEKLKQEREKRQITLEQISSSTKIGTRMLQALEEDKFNQLPGGIFNKGFVRAYSRVVGLDEDQTVAEYLQASGDAVPASTEIAAREDGARENEENISRLEAISDAHPRQLPWGLFAAALLLVALALSLWSSHRQRERAQQALHPTPTTAAMPLPATQSSGEASGRVSDKVSNPISNENSASSSPTTGSLVPGSSTTGSLTNSPPAGESAAAAAPTATPGEFTVVIRAQEESWTSITADGKPVPSPLLSAGSKLAINGRKEIVVKVGNAGGVNFRFNGKKIETGGASGEVKTLTFGPQGILPNAPSPELPGSR
jgi:cytoskeleton protein RodZ